MPLRIVYIISVKIYRRSSKYKKERGIYDDYDKHYDDRQDKQLQLKDTVESMIFQSLS